MQLCILAVRLRLLVLLSFAARFFAQRSRRQRWRPQRRQPAQPRQRGANERRQRGTAARWCVNISVLSFCLDPACWWRLSSIEVLVLTAASIFFSLCVRMHALSWFADFGRSSMKRLICILTIVFVCLWSHSDGQPQPAAAEEAPVDVEQRQREREQCTHPLLLCFA